jgi:nitroreductase
LTDRDAERAAIVSAPATPPTTGRSRFTEHLDEVPVLLVVLADLHALAAVDRDHDRYTFAGGASVYPFAWSILLAARGYGLGGVMTTMLIRHEAEVRDLLGVPDSYALAAVIALGQPVRQPRRLRREEVEEFTTVDRFDGPELTCPAADPATGPTTGSAMPDAATAR